MLSLFSFDLALTVLHTKHDYVIDDVKLSFCFTILFVVWQLQQEVQDVDERGQLIADVKLTAQRNPKVHVSLQRRILLTKTQNKLR